MSFDFPNAPTEGQIYAPVSGTRYKFNAGVWDVIGSTAAANTSDVYWPTRAALVGSVASGMTIYDGKEYTAGGYGYVGATGSTVIPDLPGLLPLGIYTAMHFGAVGDGVADDTLAIQRMLNTTARRVHFPDGRYRIVDTTQNGVATLTSTLAKRRITCDGTITATGHVYVALRVDGDDNTIQVNVDGTGGDIANGLQTYGARPIIEGCRIENLHTLLFSAMGIRAETRAGGLIRGNVIRNVDTGPGNGVLGDGWGMSRAINMVCNAGDATDQFIIENNIVTNIIGEEGDAIVIAGSGGGGVYYRAKAIIRGNTITTFNRRAVKIQAHDVQTINNTIRNTWTDIAQVPNRNAAINITQGGDQTVRGNIIENCKWFGQISLTGTPPESFDNIVIEDNIVRGLGPETTGSLIFVTSLGTGVHIRRNTVRGGSGRIISIGTGTNIIVDGNVLYPDDNPTEHVINLTSTVVNAVITNNVLFSGARYPFIQVDCADAVIANNHCRTPGSTILYRGPDHNTLLAGNTSCSAAIITNDYMGNRIGDNYAQANPGSNWFPAPMFAVVTTGPVSQLAGRYVQTGQIVFDTSPAVAGKIGWVAMGNGLAEAVIWKQFGAIDA